MVVNARFISEEITVNSEGSLNRAIGLNLCLNFSNVVRNGIDARGFVDVICIGSAVGRDACL
jgi:hypothetical protein